MIALGILAIIPYLVSCASSDNIESEDVVLVLSSTIEENEVSLRASLRQRLSDGIVISLILDEDRLYIKNKDNEETIDLERDDGQFTYSGSFTQNIGDDVELVFDRPSNDEVLSTRINIPVFYRSLRTSVDSTPRLNDVLISINWIVDSLDGLNTPDTVRLTSNAISCVNDIGEQMDISSVSRSESLAVLSMENILEQNINLSINQIAFLSNEEIQETIQYCDYEITLGSNWLVRWDGSEPPVGVQGPVWVSPDTSFGNGKIPGDDPSFGITVLASPTSIRVMY